MSGALAYRHSRVQRLRRLLTKASARQAEQAFVVEGPTLVGEALGAGWAVEALYVAPGYGGDVVDRAVAAGVRAFELAPGVLERVAGTVTPQPVLAVARMAAGTLDELRGATLVVVCVDLRDPGNLGTVIRSAEAAGVAGVVCCEGTVDAFNPKCVRASAGSLFHVRLVGGGDPVGVLEELGGRGLHRWATAAKGGVAYDEADLRAPTALVLGNEAHGLPAGLAPHTDGDLTIPIVGRAESLNVGMAAAVVCFEAARQRRSAG